MSLYFSGKDAYNTGNYEDAQEYFQQALIKDANIEAKVQNIKYMLGVSAFNNSDYKTAKTYLNLYKDNPIAEDLLKKIAQYEMKLPADFLYNNDLKQEPVIPATSASLGATIVNQNKKSENKVSVVVIVVITSLLILAIGLLLEIKSHFFSKIALKLVGVSPHTVAIRVNEEDINKTPSNENNLDNIDAISSIDPKTASLLETPFDEEINVEEMAAKDIEEISRFFENTPGEKEDELSDTTDIDQIFETDNARDSILNSLIDEADGADETDSQVFNEPETQKPKYEHLDSVPNDFDVNEAIKNAIELMEAAKKEEKGKDQEEWKTIDEKDKEIEESEKISLQYFQEMEKIDKDDLNKFFDYIFDTHAVSS